MSLTPGTRLGVYEVLSKLGEGGMGEVYRARDTRLGRDVAIKVLPEAFAADAERLARFEREARTLASINHAGIAAIYGIESHATGSGQANALVMELVEGEDLSTVIARGSIPSADALPLARQIIDALEAAHELGIVHRDLKPANIKVRPDGTVKVLDFGLAKAMDSEASPGVNPSNSPTLTARATQMGMIIGTAAYMAPEQARGRGVDRRADIWAFGVVLYEMLAGRRAFEGEDISITLASVLKEDVSWAALPTDLPSPIRRLLRRCLEKDPKRRLGWIGEARVILDDGAAAEPASSPVAIAAPTPGWQRALPWTMAVVGLAIAGVAVALWAPWRAEPEIAPVRLLSSIGADASLVAIRGPAAVLSPDGTLLAFAAEQAGQPARLYVRRLDELQATQLAGTDGADLPFFSPTGQQIGFFAGGQLKKVAVTGGAVRRLCDAPSGRGGAWTDDDTIIFSPAASSNTTLMQVSAEGGQPSVFGTLSEGAVTQRWPQALPGGTHVLYTENATTSDFEASNLVVAPLAGGAPKIVVRGGYNGRYIQDTSNPGSSAGGHLTYMQQGALYAVPFDLVRLEAVGQAVVAAEGIAADPGFGSAQIAYASNGTLVYVRGQAVASLAPVNWIARDGKVSTLRAEAIRWSEPRFSPDGRKLAIAINDGKQADIWIYDLAGDRMTQFTTDPGRDRAPIWSSDNRRIIFTSDRAKPGGPMNIYMANADGTGEVTRLTNSQNPQVAFSWHPDQTFVFFQEQRPGTTWDLMVLPLVGTSATGWKPGTPSVFLAEPGPELFPQISPDGKWVAYFSPETTGVSINVWVRPFPGPGGKWRVSEGVARFAKWSPTSHELLFLDPNARDIKAAPYTVVGNAFQPGKVTTWSPALVRQSANADPFAIHPDGKRLAAEAVVSQSAATENQVVFVLNFSDYLRKIAPIKK